MDHDNQAGPLDEDRRCVERANGRALKHWPMVGPHQGALGCPSWVGSDHWGLQQRSR